MGLEPVNQTHIYGADAHESHASQFSLQFSQLTSIDVDACRRLLFSPTKGINISNQ